MGNLIQCNNLHSLVNLTVFMRTLVLCNNLHYIQNLIEELTVPFLVIFEIKNNSTLLIHTVRVRMYVTKSSCWLFRVNRLIGRFAWLASQILISRDDSERWVNSTCIIARESWCIETTMIVRYLWLGRFF